MPVRLCSEPSCPEPQHYRGRCQTHARDRERKTKRAGYHVYRSKRWKIVRNWFLAEHPLCDCGAIATDVHHVKDLADGGAPYDPANLQALCASCHSRITRARGRS